jgi:hypothetical protein
MVIQRRAEVGGTHIAYFSSTVNHRCALNMISQALLTNYSLLPCSLSPMVARILQLPSRRLVTSWIRTGAWKGTGLTSLTAQWFNAACDSLLELEMRHRPPVVIFLSDGDDNVNDEAIYDVCRSAVGEGFVGFYLERCFSRWTHNLNARRLLSFHAVSFGQDPTTSSLRRMAQIALEVQKIAQIYLKAQNNTPDNPSQPTAATVPSSYTEALDTVSWRQSSFHFMSFIFGRIRSA